MYLLIVYNVRDFFILTIEILLWGFLTKFSSNSASKEAPIKVKLKIFFKSLKQIMLWL